MEWTQDQIGTAIAASVPIVASAVGILTALVSYTKEARLKRRAEMLRAEIAAASLPHDVAILQSLHRATTARIVAHAAVPASRTFSRVLGLLIAMFFPFAAGLLSYLALGLFIAGVLDVGTDAQRFWFFAAIPASAAALTYSYVLKGSITELLKTLLERMRMESLYLSGHGLNQAMSRSAGFPSIESLEPLSDGAKNTASRIRRRLKVTVWTGVFTLAAFAFCYGILLGGLVLNLEVDTFLINYAAPIGLAALFFNLLLAPGIIVTGFNQAPDEWLHPRPPSPAEQIRAEIETAQRPGSPNSRRGLRRIFRRRP